MKANIIYFFTILTMVGCESKNSNSVKIESLEKKVAAQQQQLENLRITKTDTTTATSSTNNYTPQVIKKKYEYIKKFKNQYPSDIKLFEKDPLKARIVTLLGKKNYKLFLDYFVVQPPIEVVNDEYTVLTAGAAHMFGTYEAGIYIDYVKDEISIGILDDKRFLLFTENKDKTGSSIQNSDFQNWIYEKQQNAVENANY